jgi:predicted protein tyrosine phosphatase
VTTAAGRLAGVRRISVLGSPGSGKSTVSRWLARSLRLPLVRLDDLYWQGDWRRPAHEEFEVRLGAALAEESWVMDGNYAASLSLRLRSTGAVVLLDPPPWLCLTRVVRRGVRRTLGWSDDLPAAVAGPRVPPQGNHLPARGPARHAAGAGGATSPDAMRHAPPPFGGSGARRRAGRPGARVSGELGRSGAIPGVRIFGRAELERFWRHPPPALAVSGVIALTDPGRAPAAGLDPVSLDLLHLSFRDGATAPRAELPDRRHVRAILAFVRAHPPEWGTLLVHCEQGISRGPTVAWLALCLWAGPGTEARQLQGVRDLRPACRINLWLATLAQAEMPDFALFPALRVSPNLGVAR